MRTGSSPTLFYATEFLAVAGIAGVGPNRIKRYARA